MAASLISAHPFGNAYAAKAGTLAAGARIDALRKVARTEIGRGLPGPKHEEWRFTPLNALSRVGFIPAAAADDVDVTVVPSDVPRFERAIRVVLVNGTFRPDLSDKISGIDIRPLSDTDTALGQTATANLPLVALNTAFFANGLAISAKGHQPQAVHIVSIGASGAEPVAFHPRVLVTTAPGAELTLIESHVGLPGQPYFANPVTEILIAEDARVHRYVTVTEDNDAFHIATTGVTVAARGCFAAFHLGLGGSRGEGTVRQEIHARVEGVGAQVHLNGAYAIGGGVHHDFTTVIDHVAGGATSKQMFKGVLDGKSHGIYQGRVRVAENAQKTDARQLHRALFLTAGPSVDVKPELEIAADDVQCAHGATTGSLDPDHLFFLAARGLDPETARMLLVEGFLADALEQIRDAHVREVFGRQVAGWLQRRGGAS